MKIVGYQNCLRITRFLTLVIRPDYQKFCLRSTPAAVGVGLHQGSSLSPYLFAMIMDLSPWCMLYADDIVLCGTRSEVVEKKLEEWRRAIEDRG